MSDQDNNQQQVAGDQQSKDPNSGHLAASLASIQHDSKEKEAMEKAQSLGMNYVDLTVTSVNPDLLRVITPEDAQNGLIFPFYRLGKKLRVTVAHPTNPKTREVIAKLKQNGYLININLSSEEGILAACNLYHSDQYLVKKKLDTKLDESQIKTFDLELQSMADVPEKLKKLNSEEGVYLICQSAVKAGASDLHLEAEELFIRVRFRIDGMLHEAFRIEKSTYENLSNQLKYQSKMRLNVTNVPQDGRFNFQINNRKIDVRVSALPTEFGESFVMRLLDSGRHLVSFEELGFSGPYLQKIEKLSQITHGMILVTGPTGSGKTTSLYTMLARFNNPESKIITLEDPIEYHLEGISQSQIQEKQGYTFASGLRAILRQDPEVIMIGEIRDQETAETAAQAALTGHVLLSTLHTNSAIETIPRLINIGLPPFMIAPALHTIIAQRLARQLCSSCKKLQPVSESVQTELKMSLESISKLRQAIAPSVPAELYQSVGCDKCGHTGYQGRVCLVEMLEINLDIRELILNRESTSKIIAAARQQGMITMREDGILKVLAGQTTLEEVHRVTANG